MTPTPSELVAKLRRYSFSGDLSTVTVCRDAADCIERLSAELELAHTAIDEACDDGNRNADAGIRWQERAEAAEKKAARYREALSFLQNELPKSGRLDLLDIIETALAEDGK